MTKGATIARQTYTTRLVGKTPQVADIVTFRLERPAGYEYQAGQWFAIAFPGPAGPYDHHFSHSSSPTEPFLEFTTRLRGSEFKNALDALPLGSGVEIEGPYGTFTLQGGPEPVALVTAGIGITCVRSILRWSVDGRDGSSTAQPPRQMLLLFANRSEDGIPFRDELTQMDAVLPELRIVHVLSHPEAGWQGYRGHVDAEVLSRELSEPQRWAYYVSGPPSFVQTAQELLVGLGIGTRSIKTEQFEGYE